MEAIMPALMNWGGLGACTAIMFYLLTRTLQSVREDMSNERSRFDKMLNEERERCDQQFAEMRERYESDRQEKTDAFLQTIKEERQAFRESLAAIVGRLDQIDEKLESFKPYNGGGLAAHPGGRGK